MGKVEIIVFKFNCYESSFANWKSLSWEDLIFERPSVISISPNTYSTLIREKHNMIPRWKPSDTFNICSWGLRNAESPWTRRKTQNIGLIGKMNNKMEQINQKWTRMVVDGEDLIVQNTQLD